MYWEMSDTFSEYPETAANKETKISLTHSFSRRDTNGIPICRGLFIKSSWMSRNWGEKRECSQLGDRVHAFFTGSLSTATERSSIANSVSQLPNSLLAGTHTLSCSMHITQLWWVNSTFEDVRGCIAVHLVSLKADLNVKTHSNEYCPCR
jgi:hypothetical protein